MPAPLRARTDDTRQVQGVVGGSRLPPAAISSRVLTHCSNLTQILRFAFPSREKKLGLTAKREKSEMCPITGLDCSSLWHRLVRRTSMSVDLNREKMPGIRRTWMSVVRLYTGLCIGFARLAAFAIGWQSSAARARARSRSDSCRPDSDRFCSAWSMRRRRSRRRPTRRTAEP